ncbi:MAG: LamG-like jellyroll fold domain-containing protein [bacterium]
MNFQKAFTLIELLVVISIIGLLASIVLVSLEGGEQRAITGKAMEFSHTVRVSLGADLVGEWKFDDGADPTRDSSGNGNNGDLVGFTTPGWTDKGIFGQALEFDGIDDYINCGSSTSLNITDEITIEAWVNMSKVGTEAYEFISKASNYCMYLYVTGASPRMMMSVNIGGGKYPQGASVIGNYNEWHHIAGVYDGSRIMNYVDGEIKASEILSGTMSTGTGILRINGRSLHKGFIDEVRIYNRALSSTEIQQLYAEGAIKHGLALSK